MTTTDAPRPSFWRRALSFALEIWGVLIRPSSIFGLGFLVLAGFIAGIFFWGAFNTALELTNTETFCTSCHEMRTNVFEELKTTVHYNNRSGVRAHCPDCHVPHEWTDKIARKMQASKEVWGKLFGTINTREKFLDHRLELAAHEWARMKANELLWNAATATARSRWILRARVRAQLRRTSDSCLRVRRPASIVTKALPTICRTCAMSPGGNSPAAKAPLTLIL